MFKHKIVNCKPRLTVLGCLEKRNESCGFLVDPVFQQVGLSVLLPHVIQNHFLRFQQIIKASFSYNNASGYFVGSDWKIYASDFTIIALDNLANN